MCYASPVMLRVPQLHPGHEQRGRGCCAISERPAPSSFASSSLLRSLSALFPLHPRNSPVSPLFPLLTQKQGGGGCLFSLSDLPSSVPGTRPDPVGLSGACPDPVGMARRFCSAFSFSPLSPIIPAPLATAALRVVPAPICTTTSRIHVGAPTFSCAKSVCRASGAGNHYAHRTQRSRAGLTSVAPTALRRKNPQDGSCRSSNCRLWTVNCELSPLSPTIPAHTGRSPVSPIIPALTQNRGGGVGYRNGNVPKICRRADIPICGKEVLQL